MKTKHLFWVAVVSCASVLRAASVSGNVSDSQGAEVPGATILLVNETGDAQWTTRSDGTGQYVISDVQPGEYLLVAQAEGFAAYKLEHVRITTGKDLKVNLPLSVGAVQQEISVTAASTPQAVDQVSKALAVVDNSTMQVMQDYSLPDLVRLTPGIRTVQQGGPAAFSEIRLRGLPPQDTAVLVDGLRLRDPSGTQADATGLLDDFLVVDANRIELLRGSGSSLYGTNAIGGVVNLITDQGGGATHGSLQLEGGSLGLFHGTALVAGGIKNDRIQYSAGISHLNVTEGVNGDQPARTSSAQGRVAFRLTPTTQVVARFFGSDGFALLSSEPVGLVDSTLGTVRAMALPGSAVTPYYLGLPVALGSATFVPSIVDPDYRRTGRYETGAVSLLGQPSESLGYAVDYQVVNSARSYDNGPVGFGFQPVGITRTDFNGRTQTVNARANYQAGRNNLLTGGYEYENENFNTYSSALPDASANSFANATQTSNTTFAQDQIRLFGDRLYVSLGFRGQWFSLQQPSFTPISAAPFQGLHFASPPAAYTGDGSFAYLFRRSNTKLRGHVGRGYRAPSLFERFGTGYDSFFGYSVYGDPDLRPEQSIGVDAGIDQSLLNNKLHITGTYFYTRLQRVIAFDSSGAINPVTDPFGRFFGYLNTRGGFSRGVELSVQWALGRGLTVSGAYTYTDAREETPLIPAVYRSFITPEHQFTTFAVQRIGKRVFIDFALNASSSYLTELFNADFAGVAYRFSGQKRADLGASYRIPLSESKGIRLFAKMQNIFDQTYYESGFLTPGATARGGLQFEF